MKNVSYVITDTESNQCVMIDPTWGTPDMIQGVGNKEMVAVWLTHTHFDHIQGLAMCRETWPRVPIYVHRSEMDQLTIGSVTAMEDGDRLLVGNGEWRVIHTPGHSPGGCCFYYAPYVITGDTVFVNGCGRYDLPGSDRGALYESIQTIAALPDETVIYPGHDYGPTPTDTVGNQRVHNGFFRSASDDSFDSLKKKGQSSS